MDVIVLQVVGWLIVAGLVGIAVWVQCERRRCPYAQLVRARRHAARSARAARRQAEEERAA